MNAGQYWLVVPAAGRGQRFGGELPKQYLPLRQRSMLEWSLQPFLADAACAAAVVAVAADDVHWAGVQARLGARVRAVHGGAERADSVFAALDALRASGVAEQAWVLVHDAARPCVTAGEILALRNTVARHATGSPLDGGLLALPLADTLKRGEAHEHGVRVSATVPRESLWRALTPQMFRLGALHAALAAARIAGRTPTDEAQAIEWAGGAPRLVAGEATNLKVTTPADFALAAQILESPEFSGER